MKKFMKDTGVKNQFRGKLTPDRIKTSSGWPKLKGQGATVRSLVPFVIHLATKYRLGKRQRNLCMMMMRFYELLDSQPLFMSSDARTELARLGQVFCDTYASLAAEHFEKRIKMWKGSPKLHLFLHLCEWQAAEGTNPRANWCYSDEDFVGKMITVAQSCHPRTVMLMSLWKWLLGVFETDEDLMVDR